AFNLPAVWIPEGRREAAMLAGYTVVDPSTVVATHLTEVFRRNLHEFLGRQEVQELLNNLSKRVDKLIVGGGIANTFLKAAGYEVGKSLYEPDLVESAAKIMEEAKGRGAAIPLPVDVVVGPALEEHAPATVLKVEEVRPDDMILDIGPATAAMYAQIIAEAGTVVWNGPVGAFEIDQFGKGTEAIAKAVAETSAYTVTGGGDSIAALEKYGYASQVDYISTAGGAFLEVLEGKTLPAVAALEARAAS
nr:phosphoglycerate kinase [Bilophila sp.]